MLDAVILLQQGRRFTHWTIADTIASPLFTIGDSAFDAQTLASTGLIFAIVYAVYSYVVEESRRQSCDCAGDAQRTRGAAGAGSE